MKIILIFKIPLATSEKVTINMLLYFLFRIEVKILYIHVFADVLSYMQSSLINMI
jgi:hypothetical protein